jgi:NAD+ kinase
MKIKNILVIYTDPKTNREKLTLNLIKATLKKYSINYKISDREKLNRRLFKNQDLVIAVGGDGTFLRSSQFVFDNTPLFGVNSNPRYKEGFFMITDKTDFEKKFKKILNGKYKIRRLHRLEAYISNEKVPELALNEFYIASEKQHHTARYFLKVKEKREKQKSSGILVSTPAGSNAWIKSAGGKILPLNSNKFEYLVREPYYGKTCAKCSLSTGILNKNEKIEVIFEVGNGILIADSLSREHAFKSGQKLTIKMSEKPLQVISFNGNNSEI